MPVITSSGTRPPCRRPRAIAATPSTTQPTTSAEVEHVPPGQQQRLAAERAAQLAERDDRAGEGDRADEHADEDLDLVRARRCSLAPGPASVGARCRPAPPRRRRSCAASRPAPASTVISTRAASNAPIDAADAERAGEQAERAARPLTARRGPAGVAGAAAAPSAVDQRPRAPCRRCRRGCRGARSPASTARAG